MATSEGGLPAVKRVTPRSAPPSAQRALHAQPAQSVQPRPGSYSGGGSGSGRPPRALLPPSTTSSSSGVATHRREVVGKAGSGEEDAAKTRIIHNNKDKLDNFFASRDRPSSKSGLASTSVVRRPAATAAVPVKASTASRPASGSGSGSGSGSEGDQSAKARRRAEIYAINAYLRTVESQRFQAFQDEITSKLALNEPLGPGDNLSEVSWSSSQSSVMPSPTYRTPLEKSKCRGGGKGGAAPPAIPAAAKSRPGVGGV